MTRRVTSTIDREQALNKMEEFITKGRVSAAATWDYVQSHQPQDQIVVGNVMSFQGGNGGLALAVPGNDPRSLHRHALQQVAERVSLPIKTFDTMLGDDHYKPWGRDLLGRTLTEIFSHSKSRFLLRSVDAQVRGFLSDKFRRIDSRPSFDAFAEAAKAIGAVPVEGRYSDLRAYLKIMVPKVYDVGGQYIAVGLTASNCDFGGSAYEIARTIWRLICVNGMIGMDVMRQIHLGSRLSDDLEFSRRTYELDSKATASAVKDVVWSYLSEDSIETYRQEIESKSVLAIEDNRAALELLRVGLSKDEQKKVMDIYQSADVVNMPATKSFGRLANAISFFAHGEADADHHTELQRAAGSLVGV